MELLRVEGITEKYQAENGEITALDNISFTVDQGEFLSIVGPSGCGKSTLLSIISGLVRPTAGRVFVKDEEVQEIPVRKKKKKKGLIIFLVILILVIAGGAGYYFYERQKPIETTKDYLENSRLSIDNIAEQTGFGQSATLRHHFRQQYALSPAQYRKQFLPVR